MTSSPLIRLQRPIPTSCKQFFTSYSKIIFWLPVTNFLIFRPTMSPITSSKIEIRQQIFDMFLCMFQSICELILSVLGQGFRFRPWSPIFRPLNFRVKVTSYISSTGNEVSNQRFHKNLKSSKSIPSGLHNKTHQFLKFMDIIKWL